MDALRLGKRVIFRWVPSHVGVYSNEHADQLATSAHVLLQTIAPLLYQGFHSKVQIFVMLFWQKEWNQEIENKLHLISQYWVLAVSCITICLAHYGRSSLCSIKP